MGILIKYHIHRVCVHTRYFYRLWLGYFRSVSHNFLILPSSSVFMRLASLPASRVVQLRLISINAELYVSLLFFTTLYLSRLEETYSSVRLNLSVGASLFSSFFALDRSASYLAFCMVSLFLSYWARKSGHV